MPKCGSYLNSPSSLWQYKYGHFFCCARLDDSADAKKILNASPLDDWKRPQARNDDDDDDDDEDVFEVKGEIKGCKFMCFCSSESPSLSTISFLFVIYLIITQNDILLFRNWWSYQKSLLTQWSTTQIVFDQVCKWEDMKKKLLC